MKMVKRNPREFWIETVKAAIDSMSDEELKRAMDAIAPLGAKVVLEIEHTKTKRGRAGNAFYFRRRVYVDVRVNSDAQFTVN